jgi:hypothetical protein
MKVFSIFILGLLVSFASVADVDEYTLTDKDLIKYEREHLAKVTFIRVSPLSKLNKQNTQANIYLNKKLRAQLISDDVRTLYICPGSYPLLSFLDAVPSNESSIALSGDRADTSYSFVAGQEYYFLLNDKTLVDSNTYKAKLVSTNTALLQVKALSREYPLSNFFSPIGKKKYVFCKTNSHHYQSDVVDLSQPLLIPETDPIRDANVAKQERVVSLRKYSTSIKSDLNIESKSIKVSNGDMFVINFDETNKFLIDKASLDKVVNVLRFNKKVSIDIVVYSSNAGSKQEQQELAAQRAYIALNALRNNGIMRQRVAKVRTLMARL